MTTINSVENVEKKVSLTETWPNRGTTDVEELAEQIITESQLRLLEPKSLPKKRRGWSPRPRPKTDIIARVAQAKAKKREAFRAFLNQSLRG